MCAFYWRSLRDCTSGLVASWWQYWRAHQVQAFSREPWQYRMAGWLDQAWCSQRHLVAEVLWVLMHINEIGVCDTLTQIIETKMSYLFDFSWANDSWVSYSGIRDNGDSFALHRRGCLPRGCLPGGCIPAGTEPDTPPQMDRMTDRCKNITFPQLHYRQMIKHTQLRHWFLENNNSAHSSLFSRTP